MVGYFKPLRRKIGMLMLMLACLSTAGWVRSLGRFESCDVSFARTIILGVLQNGSCGLSFCGNANPTNIQWQSHALVDERWGEWWTGDGTVWNFRPAPTSEWHWKWREFRIGVLVYARYRLAYIQVPCWAIVIPLTLLSVWLLLSKPPAKGMRSQPAEILTQSV